MKIKDTKIGKLFNTRGKAQEVSRAVPKNHMLEIRRVAQCLPQGGTRLSPRKGEGIEFFNVREEMPGDNPRNFSRTYSERRTDGKIAVIERVAETQHCIYMGRNSSASMGWKSGKALYSPADAATIILSALALRLGEQSEKVGLLESGEITSGAHSGAWMEARLQNKKSPVIFPDARGRLWADSTAVICSDCMGDPQDLDKSLNSLKRRRITGSLIMVVDPESAGFKASKRTLYQGFGGENEITLDHVSEDEYRQEFQKWKDSVKTIAEKNGFDFIFQRTDEPLENALLQFYKLPLKKPDTQNQPRVS